MAGKNGRWRAALVLLLGLVGPAPALAGPYLGDWSWCSRPGRDCPRSEYSPLHYWTPGLYKIRMYVRPSSLDQYPLGLYPSVPATFETTTHPCRTIPPLPTNPYADPAGYYGRPIVPE